jgi:hypothetical protein
LVTVQSEADEIRRQMATIRAKLHTEMRGVVRVTNAATDWHAYIRSHPWLAIGAAFGAGYLLVPRPSSSPPSIVVQPAPSNPAASIVTVPIEKKSRFHLLGWVFGVVSPIVLRAAQGYALSAIENLLINNPPGHGPGAGPTSPPPFDKTNSEGRGASVRV